MNLSLLAHAPLAVQVHLATVLPAFAIGTWQVFGSVKGSPLHRSLGSIDLALMTVTAAAACFIRSLGRSHLSMTWSGISRVKAMVEVERQAAPFMAADVGLRHTPSSTASGAP